MYMKMNVFLVIGIVFSIATFAVGDNASKKITIEAAPEHTHSAEKDKKPNGDEIARLRVCARESKLLRELGNASVAWLSEGKQSSILEVNKLIESLLAEPNTSVTAYFAAAKVANLCRQSDKAISILENVASKHGSDDAPGLKEPVDLIALYWIGSIARHSGDPNQAINAYKTILEKSKKLEGLNQKGYIVRCKMYLAEIATQNSKDNVTALKMLDEIEQEIASIDKDKKTEEWNLMQDWAKYKRSAIKNGKTKARQELTVKDSEKALATAVMTARVHLCLTHILGETDSSLYDGNPQQNMKVIGDASIKLVTDGTRSSDDRQMAKFLVAVRDAEMKKYNEAEKQYSELFEEDSYFSPMAGIALVHCKKAQGKIAEADTILEKVKAKYPGYELAAEELKKIIKE